MKIKTPYCLCGAPRMKNRSVCGKCLYAKQRDYLSRYCSPEYHAEYWQQHKIELRQYNTEYMRGYRANKRQEQRIAEIIARRPWHEQEAARL